jgi:hypothetical protein
MKKKPKNPQKTPHNFGTIPKSNIKIVERGKIDTAYTQM